jgi:hypothetical protein
MKCRVLTSHINTRAQAHGANEILLKLTLDRFFWTDGSAEMGQDFTFLQLRPLDHKGAQ